VGKRAEPVFVVATNTSLVGSVVLSRVPERERMFDKCSAVSIHVNKTVLVGLHSELTEC
jgi:hypothetical protein